MVNKINSICISLKKVTDAYQNYKNTRQNIMDDMNLSTEGRVSAFQKADQQFYADSLTGRKSVSADARSLFNSMFRGKYNPDDSGVNASISLLSKPEVPDEVIEDIVEKYKDDNTILSLLYSVALVEYKGFFRANMIQKPLIEEAYKSLDVLDADCFASPEQCLNNLSHIIDVLKRIIKIKNIPIDTESGTMGEVRGIILTTMAN